MSRTRIIASSMVLDIDSLPTDAAQLHAIIHAKRAQSAVWIAEVERERDRLRAIIGALKRHRFGRRSERLVLDQLALTLEDLEQMVGSAEAAEDRHNTRSARMSRRRKVNRGALPAHLPRIERVIDVADTTSPCCVGAMHKIGDDIAERLI
jgi:transposase